MSSNEMNGRTIGGTLAFCGWMISKGYGTMSQVDPWRTAIRKVFGTVEGDTFESLDWSSLDLGEYLDRFQKLAGADYKTESIVAYGRRVRNAFDAHAHYLETGRPPASRPASRRQKAADTGTPREAAVVPIEKKQAEQRAEQPGMVTFPYPLDDGRMTSFTLPPRLKPTDVNRICAFIRTLQEDSPERKQLPPHAGEQAA